MVTNDYYKNTLREQIRKEDEDLMSLSSNEDENSNDEDEKYNQEVFLKKKQEWEKGAS